MGHLSGMSVSDGAFWSLMKHVEVYDGFPIKHVGLRWFSDRVPIIIIFSLTLTITVSKRPFFNNNVESAKL